MDNNLTKWKQQLLQRGYREKSFNPRQGWWERKWFTIEASDNSILQIFNGPIYTRIIHSTHGTETQPYAFTRYASIFYGEYPKTEWSRWPYNPEFLNAAEVDRRL